MEQRIIKGLQKIERDFDTATLALVPKNPQAGRIIATEMANIAAALENAAGRIKDFLRNPKGAGLEHLAAQARQAAADARMKIKMLLKKEDCFVLKDLTRALEPLNSIPEDLHALGTCDKQIQEAGIRMNNLAIKLEYLSENGLDEDCVIACIAAAGQLMEGKPADTGILKNKITTAKKKCEEWVQEEIEECLSELDSISHLI